MHYNAKQMMGLEDPANRTTQAVQRTAPGGLALYGLTLIWFHQGGHLSLSYPDRPWYPGKEEPSYADILASLLAFVYIPLKTLIYLAHGLSLALTFSARPISDPIAATQGAQHF